MMQAGGAEQAVLGLAERFYLTPVEAFDAYEEALDGVDVAALLGTSTTSTTSPTTSNLTRRAELLSAVQRRTEQVDVQRDAISLLLTQEVRKSSSGLREGMQQVSDVDLDITRTLLYVKSLRRRLAQNRVDMVDSPLLISQLQQRIDESTELQRVSEELAAALAIRGSYANTPNPSSSSSSLSDTIAVALQSLSKVQQQQQETEAGQQLVAIKSVEQSLKSAIKLFDSNCRAQIKTSLTAAASSSSSSSSNSSSSSDREALKLFQDGMRGLQLLNKTEQDVFSCLEEIWVWVVETTLLGGRNDEEAEQPSPQPQLKTTNGNDEATMTTNGGGGSCFPQLLASCRMFDKALQSLALHSTTTATTTSTTPASLPKQIPKLKQRALHTVTASTERFLSSPETRSLPLLPFARVIQEASTFAEQLGTRGCFASSSSSSSHDEHGAKAKLESMLRLRSRIYAQTFQAEGFQAMRGLLWRETWTNVLELEPGQDFVSAIFTRLGLERKQQEEEEWMITATLASGIPRQIQRTLDLMHNLPASACGEAFLGLHIVFDLYLYAVCSVFLPNLLAKLIAYDPVAAARALSPTYANKTLSPPPPSPQQSPPPVAVVASTPLLPYLHQTRESLLEWISSEEDELCEQHFALRDGTLSNPCLVAAGSLAFLAQLVSSLEQPMLALLPAIERNSLATRTFTDLPLVLASVQAQCRESAVQAWLRPFIYFPSSMVRAAYRSDDDDDDDDDDGNVNGRSSAHTSNGNNTTDDNGYRAPATVTPGSEFSVFVPVLQAMKLRVQELLNLDGVKAKPVVWDEAVRYLLDRFLDALAGLARCSVMNRGQMALHLASFWDALQSFPLPPGPAALRAKLRVDDFIKAYYFDTMGDFSQWAVRNKHVYDTFHLAAVFETGMLAQTSGGVSRELRQEFDRLIASL